jgi:hypothetical protein
MMVDPGGSVEIDRIRLHGLELTPERAERVRLLIEVELGRLLTREEYGERLTAAEVSSVSAPALNVNPAHNESQFAGGLARSIAQGLLRSQ